MSETRAADATVCMDSPRRRRPRSSASIRTRARRRRSDAATRAVRAEPPGRTAKESGLQKFLRQYKDLMQIVLLAVAIISIVVLQDFATGIFIIGLTVLNAVLGLNQGKAAESVRRCARC